MQELQRKIRYLFEAIITGDRPWGCVRLVFSLLAPIMALVLFLIFFPPLVDFIIKAVGTVTHSFAHITSTAPAHTTPYPIPKGPEVSQPPSTVFQLIRDLILSTWGHRRYLLAFAAAIAIAFIVGGLFIQDIYELSSFRMGLRYVLTAVFGFPPYPRLVIADGQMQVSPDESNTLRDIGGPGFIIIRPGNLVLFERLHSPAAVRSAGIHFISRFETVKDVVPLEEQDGMWPELSATTKDGIEIRVKDIRFRYRLYPGRRLGGITSRTWEEPYPYSTQAVINYAYNRSVDDKGVVNIWFNSVRSVVDSAISEYISTHTIDELTAPGATNADPRGKIKHTLESGRTRRSLKDVGAELLWCDIGHFEIADKRVSAQRLETWQTKWAAKADQVRAEGEAQRLAYQEQGRAEGQAELLQSIVQSFEEIGLDKSKARSRLRSIVLMRTAQILEAMTERYRLTGGDTTGSGATSEKTGPPKLPG